MQSKGGEPESPHELCSDFNLLQKNFEVSEEKKEKKKKSLKNVQLLNLAMIPGKEKAGKEWEEEPYPRLHR